MMRQRRGALSSSSGTERVQLDAAWSVRSRHVHRLHDPVRTLPRGVSGTAGQKPVVGSRQAVWAVWRYASSSGRAPG